MTSERPQCTGHAASTGQRCTKPPIRGGTVCAKHGGAAPQVREAARRRLLVREVEAEALAVLGHEGIEQVGDPVLELGRLASEARALTTALARRVNALQDIRYRGERGSEQLRSEVSLYERALDRTARFMEILARLGYESRRVQVTEDMAAQVAGALRSILHELDLSPEQERRAPEIVAGAMLRLVDAS